MGKSWAPNAGRNRQAMVFHWQYLISAYAWATAMSASKQDSLYPGVDANIALTLWDSKAAGHASLHSDRDKRSSHQGRPPLGRLIGVSH